MSQSSDAASLAVYLLGRRVKNRRCWPIECDRGEARPPLPGKPAGHASSHASPPIGQNRPLIL